MIAKCVPAKIIYAFMPFKTALKKACAERKANEFFL